VYKEKQKLREITMAAECWYDKALWIYSARREFLCSLWPFLFLLLLILNRPLIFIMCVWIFVFYLLWDNQKP